MKIKKVTLLILCFLMFSNSFSFFRSKEKDVVLRVGVTPVPHGEILRHISDQFQNESFRIEIVEYSDYNQPNLDLKDGKIDVNYFQHKEFLEMFNMENRAKLIPIDKIHFEKMGLYSNKVKSIKGIDGKIAIPNDESNKIRALKLLETSGLIELDENYNIIKNPKNIEITEINSHYLYKIIDEVDAIIVNANFILENGYIPSIDSLFLEEYNDEYANLLVSNNKTKKNVEIERLSELLRSPEVRRFVKNIYKDSIVIID